jgi:hypothetical protein
MLGGFTAIAVNGGGTVNSVDPLTLPEVALMVVVPNAMIVANPLALMVAVAGVDEFHVTIPVRSLEVPSE